MADDGENDDTIGELSKDEFIAVIVVCFCVFFVIVGYLCFFMNGRRAKKQARQPTSSELELEQKPMVDFDAYDDYDDDSLSATDRRIQQSQHITRD